MNEEIARGEVIIFASPGLETKIEVKMKGETVWLSQAQMAELFDKDIRTINEHIQNVYEESELEKNRTIRKFRIVRFEGKRQVNREIEHYNLDVIISVGYRVKSMRGTQFRIWANRILKEYLIQGYSINEKLLGEEREKFQELQKMIDFINKKKNFDLLAGQEKELISLINEFANSFAILNKYDKGDLVLLSKKKSVFVLDYDKAKMVIGEFRQNLEAKGQAHSLFSSEIGEKFKGILGAIYQTYGGDDLYVSVEEKAANLLYLIIKDHPFSDGNKRIGSLLFVYFLQQNDYLYKTNGEKKINDNTLVAMALLVAVGDPKEKDTMVKLITNLLS